MRTLAVLAALAVASPAFATSPSFPQGVAAGDVRQHSATLWTRVGGGAGPVVLEVSDDDRFRRPDLRFVTRADPSADGAVQVFAVPLEASTRYHYRFRAGQNTSPVGSFVTPPERWARKPVRIAWTGDSDGTRVNGVPYFTFDVLRAVAADRPDAFIYLGDTIYSDSSLRALDGRGPASSLDEYRAAYREARQVPALQELLRTTGTVSVWDDHEVRNDYDGQSVDPALYEAGRQAFLESLPVGPTWPLPADGCAGPPLVRTLSYGRDIDVIVLDQRSCRSPSVELLCLGDVAPGAPAPLRVAFGLPPAPPPGCLEAIADPARTMLGPAQKEFFKRWLHSSDAKFKLVVSELAVQQFLALPYDRWEGYAAERRELLEFIRDAVAGQVVFLTTDNHANLVNEVAVDAFAAPQAVAHELVTGPIGTFTLQQEVLAGYGPALLGGFQQILTLVGMNCRHLDAFSYGVVDYDPATRSLDIRLQDVNGAQLHDQLDSSVACSLQLR